MVWMVFEKCTESMHQMNQLHFTHDDYRLYIDTDEGLDATSGKPISQWIHCSHAISTGMLIHMYILCKFPEYVSQMACNKLQCVTRYNKKVKKCKHNINTVVHSLFFYLPKKTETLQNVYRAQNICVSFLQNFCSTN